MGGAESVVDVELRRRGELLREGRVVRLFARIEAEVLEEEHLSIGELSHGVVHRRPRDLARELHRSTEERGEPLRHGSQAELRRRFSFGTAEMGGDDEPGPALDEEPQSRERFPDPGVVRDRPVLEGHVEVHADEDPPPLHVEAGNAQLLHGKVVIIAQLPRPCRMH
jgi:hypothetical protein